jgi:hypothetical protein
VLVLVKSKQIAVSEVRGPMYGSIETLRQLLSSEGTEAQILSISPKGYTLSNGIDYCYVGIKSKDDSVYSIHAYGIEAIELRNAAMKLCI